MMLIKMLSFGVLLALRSVHLYYMAKVHWASIFGASIVRVFYCCYYGRCNLGNAFEVGNFLGWNAFLLNASRSGSQERREIARLQSLFYVQRLQGRQNFREKGHVLRMKT